MGKCREVSGGEISAKWQAKAIFVVALLDAIYDIGALHYHTL
jgi:hypothetical protein